MKKVIFIIIQVSLLAASLVAVLSMFSCRRATNNGKIDGNWRIETMEDVATGEVSHPVNFFLAIQLEMAQFREESAAGGPQLNALISYTKGADEIGMEFPEGAGNYNSYLETFRMPSRNVTFRILKLDCSKLVLESPTTIYRCSRI